MHKIALSSFVLALGVCGCSSPGDASDASAPVDDAAVNDVGVPQCNPSTCSSGHCAPDGGCAQGCQGGGACATGETCCNDTFCTNLSRDPANCGACGTACSTNQFCTGTDCESALVMNVCRNASGDVVDDGLATDEDAGGIVSSALGSACSGLALTTISQGAAGSMDPTSGRPEVGPGTTYVAVGGSFGQKAIAYMNGARNAPIYTTDDGQNVSFFHTSDGSKIVTAPIASLTAHHDYFLVYAAAEPVSGTLVFAVYGLYAPGTAAGAYWLSSQATSVSSLSKQYYVYEWTDTNGDGAPNAADTFTLLDSN
jgi:hypothetical protein